MAEDFGDEATAIETAQAAAQADLHILAGARVSVRWRNHGRISWYEGTVASVNPTSSAAPDGSLTVVYTDGDKRTYTKSALRTLPFKILSMSSEGGDADRDDTEAPAPGLSRHAPSGGSSVRGTLTRPSREALAHARAFVRDHGVSALDGRRVSVEWRTGSDSVAYYPGRMSVRPTTVECLFDDGDQRSYENHQLQRSLNFCLLNEDEVPIVGDDVAVAHVPRERRSAADVARPSDQSAEHKIMARETPLQLVGRRLKVRWRDPSHGPVYYTGVVTHYSSASRRFMVHYLDGDVKQYAQDLMSGGLVWELVPESVTPRPPKEALSEAESKALLGATAPDGSPALLHRRVNVLWPRMNATYSGMVVKYAPDRRLYSIRYDDGDLRTLDEAELHGRKWNVMQLDLDTDGMEPDAGHAGDELPEGVAEARSFARTNPTGLLGCRVSVRWKSRGRHVWYAGTVTAASDAMCTVQYDDGETKSYNSVALANGKLWRIVSHPSGSVGSARAAGAAEPPPAPTAGGGLLGGASTMYARASAPRLPEPSVASGGTSADVARLQARVDALELYKRQVQREMDSLRGENKRLKARLAPSVPNGAGAGTGSDASSESAASAAAGVGAAAFASAVSDTSGASSPLPTASSALDECPVCLSTMVVARTIAFQCGHRVCNTTDCASLPECPICRAAITLRIALF